MAGFLSFSVLAYHQASRGEGEMQSIPDKGGVPRLSRDDIESKAEEVLGAISPAALRFPQLTPLTDLIIKFSSEYQTKFIFDLDLGMSKSGKRILGKFVTNPR